MKMRDKLKDEAYFNTLIEKEKKNIVMFENAVKKAKTEKGELDKGTRNGYNILISSYEKEINILYSCGEALETVEECYKKFLFYFGKMWDRRYGYIELVKVLSLAVLFGIAKEDMSELEERLISQNVDDYLVNFLIKRIDSTWTNNGNEFEFPGVYDYLKLIIENEEGNACELLTKYLREKWYSIHKECVWYDSHKLSKSIYCGYWSFEAGAIAKILNIDDSNMRDMPYYPYDLVHYGE